jgi:hypothetical protein
VLKKNKDTKKNKAFWKHVSKCSKIVAEWPKWKRNLKVSAHAMVKE